MSVLFSLSGTGYIGTAAGTLGAAGTGDYTMIGLHRPSYPNTCIASLRSGSLTGTNERDIIGDFQTATTTSWFGVNDFSAGFGPYNINTWYLVGQSKAAGSNVFRWHIWPYAADGSGTKTHADGTGAHGDGSTIAGVQIGNGDHYAQGEMALVAVWKRVLSDADFNSLCGNTASAFMNLSTGAPDALWLMNVSDPSTVVDATGNGANATTVVASSGTITGNGTDPPSFNYSLSGTGIAAPWFKM